MRKPRECKPECRCILCNKARPAKTHQKVCLTVPADLWEAFSDELILLGLEKSPTVSRLVQAFMKQRKDKRS